MKKVTSITLHTTSEGQRISYTYSVIDENTGVLLSDNNRESMIVLDITSNKKALEHIEALKLYVTEKMGE